jgi:hypothetical protein
VQTPRRDSEKICDVIIRSAIAFEFAH